MMRYIILDTETTGLYPLDGDRLVKISAVEVCNREIGRTFHTLINPGCPIPDAVAQLHGITDDKVCNAPCFTEIGREFLDFIEGGTLVAHNAAFDLGFIVKELALAHLPAMDDMPVIDSLVIARKHFPEERNNLESLCDRFGIDRSGSESGDNLLEVKLLAQVFLAMTTDEPASSADVKTVRNMTNITG